MAPPTKMGWSTTWKVMVVGGGSMGLLLGGNNMWSQCSERIWFSIALSRPESVQRREHAHMNLEHPHMIWMESNGSASWWVSWWPHTLERPLMCIHSSLQCSCKNYKMTSTSLLARPTDRCNICMCELPRDFFLDCKQTQSARAWGSLTQPRHGFE